MTDDGIVHPQVRATLDRLGAPYDVIECDEHLADTEQFCAHYGYPLDTSANTILVTSKRGPKRRAACVLLATTRLNVNTVVRREIGAPKVSFADPAETLEVTGMELGGVTPFALPDGVPLLVDGRVLRAGYVILGSGTRRGKIKTSPDVLRLLPDARIVDDLAA